MKKCFWVTTIALLIIVGLILIYKTTNISIFSSYSDLRAKSNESLTVAKMDEVKKDINKQLESKTGDVLGMVAIPSVGIDLAILKGSTKDNLYKGATTLKDNQLMGKGNYTLAGHHMKDETLFFGKLHEMKVSDKILLTDKKNIYVYVMTKRKNIHETEVDILNDGKGSEVTLITCDKPTSTEYRTVVIGELESEYKYSEGKWDKMIKSFQ
ncbi:class A sortase [Bacillus safensis]|uniref:class A sortase n=1 Tax=Bacillus safensis TaxID=561879 RepID=UPI002E1E96E8|nr:class A sortase [Bacillus safensis]